MERNQVSLLVTSGDRLLQLEVVSLSVLHEQLRSARAAAAVKGGGVKCRYPRDHEADLLLPSVRVHKTGLYGRTKYLIRELPELDPDALKSRDRTKTATYSTISARL